MNLVRVSSINSVDKRRFKVLASKHCLHDIESDGRTLPAAKDPPGQRSSYILPGEDLFSKFCSKLKIIKVFNVFALNEFCCEPLFNFKLKVEQTRK